MWLLSNSRALGTVWGKGKKRSLSNYQFCCNSSEVSCAEIPADLGLIFGVWGRLLSSQCSLHTRAEPLQPMLGDISSV